MDNNEDNETKTTEKTNSKSPEDVQKKSTKCPENEEKLSKNEMILEDEFYVENLSNEKIVLNNIENILSNENSVKLNSDQIQTKNVLNYSNDIESSLEIDENSQNSSIIADENDQVMMEENAPVNLTPGNYFFP